MSYSKDFILSAKKNFAFTKNSAVFQQQMRKKVILKEKMQLEMQSSRNVNTTNFGGTSPTVVPIHHHVCVQHNQS